MHKDYQRKYLLLEERYWWFVARRDIILRLIKNYSMNLTSKILDIGCSGGILLKDLKNRGYSNIFGIDINKNAIKLCRSKDINNVCLMDTMNMGFKDEQFDIIIASDILEHIKEEDRIILEWKRVLKKEGIIICFVPAFNFLWSGHDIINFHYRRYSKPQLISLFKRNKFSIIQDSYWNFTLFFPVFILRLFENLFKRKKIAKNHLYNFNKLINNFLIKLLYLENRILISFIKFPVGVSTFIIAKK